MIRRSLAEVLARQWMAYTLALFALFVASALFLLWVVEDHFIDRRLADVAATVSDPMQAPALPAKFRLWPAQALPSELATRLRRARPGQVAEMRLADGRYVHVMLARAPSGERFALEYDVSDQLLVNAGLVRAAPWLVGISALLCLLAWVLARWFVARVSQRAAAVLAQVRTADDPAQLRAYAESESVREFSELARLQAQAWEERLALLERERQTLAFLAHELRTPLQSARNSLALVRNGQAPAAVWHRLQRAIDRLARAGNSVLWLASDVRPGGLDRTPVGLVLHDLADEMAPLAEARQQTVVLRGAATVRWPLPRESVETVLANLLLNAIQHGGPGTIRVSFTAEALTIANPVTPEAGTPGFGLGLQIVERLVEGWGWTLARNNSPRIRAMQVIRLSAGRDGKAAAKVV